MRLITHCVEHSSLHLSPVMVAVPPRWDGAPFQGKDEAPAFRLRLLVHLTTLSAVLPTHGPAVFPGIFAFPLHSQKHTFNQQPESRLPVSEACISDPNTSQAHSNLISKQPLEWGYPQFIEEMEAWIKKYAHTVYGGACL